MAVWQQKAIELFPDPRSEIGIPDATIYSLFRRLLTRCIAAHSAGNTPLLEKIYGFAEWCLAQHEEDVWNAAGVSFYEHLVDQPETIDQIPAWLSPDVFVTVSGLFEWRMEPHSFASLINKYCAAHPGFILRLVDETDLITDAMLDGEGI
jgi:hypothetical protein